jgi:mono/diheme cytochrome c family protein
MNLTYDVAMRILRPQYVVLALVFVLLATTGSAVYAQTKQVKVEPAKSTNAWKGDDLYREFCAVCHGIDGKGNGPAADALKARPSDLTQISRHNGNKFPTLHMQRVIAGDDAVSAHGNHDMPIWGDSFKSISANGTFAEMRVNALVDYLQKIQK